MVVVWAVILLATMMVAAMVVMVAVLEITNTELQVVVEQADMQAMAELELAQEQAASIAPLPHVKVSMVLLDQVVAVVVVVQVSDAEILMGHCKLALVAAWAFLGKAATGPQVHLVVTTPLGLDQVAPANRTEEEAA